MATEVTKHTSKGVLIVSRIYASENQKEGTMRAELKQTRKVVSIYPTRTVTSNLQDSIFGIQEYDFKEKEFVNETTLVAWMDIPQGVSVEALVERLKKFPEATIYKIVDNKPILTDNQEYAISQGLRTMDDYANAQIVRHGADDPEGKWAAGDLVLDNLGRPVYKATFFSSVKKEDVDRRDSNPQNYYVSEEIQNEMAGVAIFSQTQGI